MRTGWLPSGAALLLISSCLPVTDALVLRTSSPVLPGITKPELVAFLSTPSNWPRIVASSVAVRGPANNLKADSPLRLNDAVDEVFGLPPVFPLEVTWRCDALDARAGRLGMASREGLPGVAADCRMDFSVTEASGGGCSVDLAMSFAPISPLAVLALPVLVADNALAIKVLLPRALQADAKRAAAATTAAAKPREAPSSVPRGAVGRTSTPGGRAAPVPGQRKAAGSSTALPEDGGASEPPLLPPLDAFRLLMGRLYLGAGLAHAGGLAGPGHDVGGLLASAGAPPWDGLPPTGQALAALWCAAGPAAWAAGQAGRTRRRVLGSDALDVRSGGGGSGEGPAAAAAAAAAAGSGVVVGPFADWGLVGYGLVEVACALAAARAYPDAAAAAVAGSAFADVGLGAAPAAVGVQLVVAAAWVYSRAKSDSEIS